MTRKEKSNIKTLNMTERNFSEKFQYLMFLQ